MAHSAYYTSASFGHIRLSPKDGNLGLGANARDENDVKNMQRLGTFNDILSRLNGGEDPQQEAKKRRARADLGRKLYLEQKFGSMHFVRAGFLVGSDIVPHIDTRSGTPERSREPISLDESELIDEKGEKKRRKEEKRQRKAEKELRKLGEAQVVEQEAEAAQEVQSDTPATKPKKKKMRKPADAEADPEPQHLHAYRPQVEESGIEAKRCRKLEKRARKEAKKSERAQRMETASIDQVTVTANLSGEAPQDQNRESSTAAMVSASIAATPVISARASRGMQAVRRKHIQSKTMAGMDAEALREVGTSTRLLVYNAWFTDCEQILMVKAA